MIKYHIYPSSLVTAPDVNEKAMMRFVRKMGEDAIDIITLAKADRLSARGQAITDEMVETNLANLDKLQNFYLEKKDAVVIKKLLNGNEIMQALKIKAGPQLGEIIDKLYEAQLNGEITTKDEALAFVKKFKV